MNAIAVAAAPIVPFHPVADLSARDLHRVVLDCKKIGNRARYELIRALRTLKETGLHFQLGFPDIASYGDRVLGYKRSTTFEAISVAEKLDELPLCSDSFTRGDLSWTALRDIVRVANVETESQWIEYAEVHSTAQLHIEAQDAAEKNRPAPREDRYGLPNLMTKIVLELSLAEREVLEKGLDRVGATMVRSLGEEGVASEQVSVKDVLLFLARRALETESGDPLEGRVPREEPSHTLLYHTCPDCRRSRLATKQGMVEVPREVVDRIEGEARVESIALAEELATGDIETGDVEILDRPNPTRLSRRVKLRDGGVCSNPNCTRDACHSHHIVYRSAGGPTQFSNETAVCGTCHALIHEGLLRVEGNPVDGLSWSTAADSMRSDVQKANELPTRMPAMQSTRVDSVPRKGDQNVAPSLVRVLVRLGYPKEVAAEVISQAIRVLMGQGIGVTEQEILQQALCPNGRGRQGKSAAVDRG